MKADFVIGKNFADEMGFSELVARASLISSQDVAIMSEGKDPEPYFDVESPLFEDQSKENGFTSWSARQLAKMLGYKDYANFKNAINKAQQVCLSLEINLSEHFRQEVVIEDGKEIQDIRLSRFACYLVVMNGDPKKIQVAKAQAYFATFAEACRRYIEQTEHVERVLYRDEISEREETLASTAKKHGVEHYSFFQNAGYRGLYNMNIKALRSLKKISQKRSPLDFMGKEELAANLFRITQTEAKIKNEGVRGQRALENTAHNVGRTVRRTMEEISGTKPEHLSTSEDIRKVRSGLKSTQKGLSKIDSTKKKKLKNR